MTASPVQEVNTKHHRFTYEEALEMVRAGILPERARIELIDGELLDMSPIGDEHDACVDRSTHLFVPAVGGRAIVRVQGNIRLSQWNAPMPDLILLKPHPRFYAGLGAGPADVLLVIEVSDTTLAYDRGRRARLYSDHGVPEYWIYDVNAVAIIVHREPSPDGYQQVFTVMGDIPLSPLAFPDLVFTPNQLLGISAEETKDA